MPQIYSAGGPYWSKDLVSLTLHAAPVDIFSSLETSSLFKVNRKAYSHVSNYTGVPSRCLPVFGAGAGACLGDGVGAAQGEAFDSKILVCYQAQCQSKHLFHLVESPKRELSGQSGTPHHLGGACKFVFMVRCCQRFLHRLHCGIFRDWHVPSKCLPVLGAGAGACLGDGVGAARRTMQSGVAIG